MNNNTDYCNSVKAILADVDFPYGISKYNTLICKCYKLLDSYIITIVCNIDK